jgi:ribonuclease E
VSFLADAQPSAVPVTISPPAPTPPSTPAQADDPASDSAPRRAGWWSRRFGGGE